MASLKLTLSASAKERMSKAIAHQAGKKMRTIVTALHQQILDNTAFNTGRTLGSWYGSAGSPISYDIGDVHGTGLFAWNNSLQHTNRLSVGSESGRQAFEKLSLTTTKTLQFEKNPYRIFYITNGAKLDSGNDFADGISSDLKQGAGSRAYYQEYGRIAKFNLFASTDGVDVFDFAPRGDNALERAVNTIRGRYGR